MRIESERPGLAAGLRWFSQRPCWTLAFLVLLALVPFINKPFNIDDPLFVWAARQIHDHPANPYGFDVNWNESGDTAAPMWQITKNPPLACYYLALAAGILGWNEPGLHLAFLLPALAVILGTYRLAKRFCDLPFLAAVTVLFTPVFLVSSTSVMCDTMMLAFWVWSVAFWLEGVESGRQWKLAVGATLIALAALTKYFGAALLPLIIAYTWILRRRPGFWLFWLIIPVAVLFAYRTLMASLYGADPLSDAAMHSSRTRDWFAFPLIATSFIGLGFTGGCLAGMVFCSAVLWGRRFWAVAGAFAVVILALSVAAVHKKYRYFEGPFPLLLGQMAFWAFGGISILALAMADLFRQRKEARSWMLFLWVLGTFVFTTCVNWTINGRSLLPMAPAAGILLARRWAQSGKTTSRWGRRAFALAGVVGAALALWVARSDYLFAHAVRRSVQEVGARLPGQASRLWFFGHWGFQFYMQEMGARPADRSRPTFNSGDWIAVPAHNPSALKIGAGQALARADIYVPGPKWLTTMNDGAGAGYYSSFLGPLPFAFGRVPAERVVIGEFGAVAAPPP